MKEKIAILGNTGMLGRYAWLYFKRKGYDVLGFSRANSFDACAFVESLTCRQKALWQLEGVDYVINCIGVIKQKSNDPVELFAINSDFPLCLADKLPRNTRMIHVSSDCVFSGYEKRNLFDAFACRDAKDFYGKSKALGEDVAFYEHVRVVRTSIIGEELQGKKSLLEWCKSQAGMVVPGYTNHYWNGVTCLELCKAMHGMIRNFNMMPSLQNYVSPEVVSKCKLIQLISDVYGLNLKVQPTRGPQDVYRALRTIFSMAAYVTPIGDQLVEQKNFSLTDDAQSAQS